MEDFYDYKEQFIKTFADAESGLNAARKMTGMKRSSAFVDVVEKLKVAKSLIVSMSGSAHQAGKASEVRDEITGYEQSWENLRKVLKTAQDLAGPDDRRQLGPLEMKKRAKEEAERDKHFKNELDTRQDNLTHLDDILAEGETITQTGGAILVDLHQQGTVIEQVKDKLGKLSFQISDSRRLLLSVWAQMTTGQVVRFGIILILLIGCFMVVYMKWIYVPAVAPAPAPAVAPTPTAPTPGNRTVTTRL